MMTLREIVEERLERERYTHRYWIADGHFLGVLRAQSGKNMSILATPIH